VSRTGGDWPRWSRDSRELFFMSNNLPENTSSIFGILGVAKVSPKGGINLDHPGGDYPTYALRRDGALLVFIWANVTAATGGRGAAAPPVVSPDAEGGLTVARHWERRLRK
jgi:hypothetical protein